MANVRVAVRVRPLSKREIANGGKIIIEIDDKVAKIKNLKVDSRPDGPGGSREKVVAFGFDYCYWSVNPEDPQYASQDVVFQDLGTEVLSGATKGYNICLFAYGQTGSGKTYTMIGTPGLFSKEDDYSNLPSSCRIRVRAGPPDLFSGRQPETLYYSGKSFLEIYNERVRDLLKQSDQKKPYTLRVREHPETGPYVQGLSQHVVTNSKQIIGLLEEGVANRITAATHVHEASSRSHAIFTIYYTQAVLENNLSSEIASKINLVDLAGSERADPSYCKDRITEGASINKSLVTLGIVISTLAQNSQVFISYQSPNSTSSEGGDRGSLSSPSVAASIGGVPRKQSYIPYRDSVLTWLLKDSLGGNSKTIMVATVSPANSCYSETMSTLRYASSAKNIINKPRVNEDANVKLIRELREEIERLKGMLLSFELGNLSPFTDGRNGNLKELVLHNEMKKDQLSKDWTQKWNDWKVLMEQYNVDINKKKAGVTIDSNLPHLMVLDDDVLSTGVVLYHLREGTTKIGRMDSAQEQDIVLQGQWIERDHCTITSARGVVTLQPALGARCIVNGQEVTDSCRLTQGAIIILGETQKFRFIHPAEAAALRQKRLLGEVSVGNSSCSLEWLDLDGDITAPELRISSVLEEDRRVWGVVPEAHHQKQLDQAVSHRTQICQQKRLVEDLKQDILVGQIRAEQELKFEQALINQQIKDNQQWLLREESRLASLQQQQQQQQQQQDGVLAETDPEIFHEAEPQTGPKTSSALLDGDRERLVQLQVLWRNALWAAERKVRRKKVKFQLERIVKKQKLLEAQRRLEQLETLCWEDNPSQPVELDLGVDATFPAFQKKSRSSCSISSVGNQRLCGLSLSPSQSVLKCDIPAKLSAETVCYTPEKPQSEECLLQAAVRRGSTIPSNGSCPPSLCQVCEGRRASFREDTSAQRTSPTMSPKIASATDRKSQEMGRNKQLMRLHRNLVSVGRSSEHLRSREKPDSLIPSPRIGREKPPGSHGPPRRRCRREGDLLTNRASRGNGSSSPHPQGAKRSVICGKIQRTRLRQAAWALEQWEPSAASLARASAWPWGCLSDVKDRDESFLQNLVKTECDRGTCHDRERNSASQASSSPLGARPQENENDFSDTDSTYSLDSLSCAYSGTLIKPQKQEAPEPKPHCTEPENSESDDSQMSQDSLVEKRNRTQRRLLHCSPPPQASERREARPVASPEASLPTPGSRLPWKKVRTFSLDSLNNEEEACTEESKEGSTSPSSDEMPVEVFWQMKSSPSFIVCQEKVLEFQTSDQGSGAGGPDVSLQPSGSFYLAFQPKTEGDKCKPLQQTQHPRNNSLASVDSWFSCDSGSNPKDSQEVKMYSQMNLHIQQPEVQAMEKPKAAVEAEGLQQPAPEVATAVYRFSHLQGSALVPNSTNEVTMEPSLVVSSEATWRSQGPCKSGSDATVSQESFHKEGRGLPNQAGYCNSVPSDGTLTSIRSAAPASLLSHKGSSLRKGRPVVEYLCEFSQSSQGATVKSTQVSSSSLKDTSYLPFTSSKRWDSFFPVCPKMPDDFDFSGPSFSLPSMRHLRREQEQNGGSSELDDLSAFFRTIEKDAHCSSSSTDLEAGDSGLENAWVFAAENRISASMTELHQAHEGSSKQLQPLVCRRAGSAVSFDESFFLRDISNSSSPMIVKGDQGSPTWAQQDENPPSKLTLSQPVMKAELLQNATEEIDRERSFSLALPTDSESFPPWDPFPSPEQLHPLETFYVLESRDALTETALEIPACREWEEDMPPTNTVESLNHTFQFLRNLDSDLLLLLHTPNPKNPSSQQVVAERSFSPDTSKDLSGTGVPTNMEKYSNPISFSSAQDRLLLESISMAVCQLGKPAGILSNKHPQSSLKIKETAPAQPSWGVPFNDSGAMMHLPVISSIGGDREHRQSENDVRGKQAGYLQGIGATDFEGQIHSGPNSNFIYKTESLSPTQHRVYMQENVLVPKKCSLASHSRCMSPVIMVKDETSSHPREGTESVSLGMVLHPQDCSEGVMHHREDHSYGKDSALNLLPGVSSKEEGPVASKEPESLMVMPNSQGEISRRRNQISSEGKIVNHSEEMARLISSVSELESSILEIDSRQKYPPRALYMAEACRRAICKDRKEQVKARLTLRPNDFRDSPSYRDQPHSSKKVQEEEEVPSSVETRGIKEVSSCIQKSEQAQKITPNLTRPTEFIEEDKTEREHILLPIPKLSEKCPSDYLFLRFSQRCTAQKKPANAPESPEIAEPLVKIEPLRPEEERSEGSCNEQSASELNPQSHATVRTGHFPELEAKASFQESQAVENLTSTTITAKCEEPIVHDIDQETNASWGKSLQTETHPAPVARELPDVSQIKCTGRYRTQQTVPPLPSQEGCPVAAPQEGTGNILSSGLPKRSEKYFRSTVKAVSLSSTNSESELEFLKTQGLAPSESRVEQQKKYGEARNCSSLRSNSCKKSFVEQSVCQSFLLRTASGLCYQPNGGGSPSEPSGDSCSKEEVKASATAVLLEQQGGDTRITPTDLNLGNASLTKVALLRNMKRAGSLNQCLPEKRASHQQADSELQAPQALEKKPWRTEEVAKDLSITSTSLSATVEGKLVSSAWGFSATPSVNAEANVETIVEDTEKDSKECGKSSKDSTSEQIIVPKLTRVSSGLRGTSANPSMYPKTNIETIMEDTGLSEECGNSSKDSTGEQMIVPGLSRVSSGFWGASATPSMNAEANVETIVEDTKRSMECGKSSKDSTNEQMIVPKPTRVSPGFWGASANSSMSPEVNVETTVEDTRLSEEGGKSSKDSTYRQMIVPCSETQPKPEAFSGTPKLSHYNQRDQLELDRTQEEDESQVCFMQNKATRGHIQKASPGIASEKHPDKNKPLAKLYVEDGLQLRKGVTAPSRGQKHASPLSFSTMANPSICKPSNTQAAGEKLTGQFDPQVLSESPDKKEEVIRSPSAHSHLASANLLFPSASKENKRDEPLQQQLFAPSPHAISNSIRIIRPQTGAHSEVERASLGSRESIRRAWEGFRAQSTAYESLCGGDLGSPLEAMVDLQSHRGTSVPSPWKDGGSEVAAAEMSYVMANSATLWPTLRSHGSFHNRKQPVSCEAEIVEAEEPPYLGSTSAGLDIKQSGSLPAHPRCVHSPGSGERKANHKQDMMVSGIVEGGSKGSALPQCPKLKGVTMSGQSVAYGADSKCPSPTSLLDQSLTPAFVREMKNCPEGSMVQNNLETSKSSIIFSPSASQEEVVTSPSSPPCTSQQGTAWINSPSFINSLAYGNNSPEKRIPRSASDTMLPVFLVSSKLNGGHQSRGSNIPLDLREDQRKLRLAASSTGLGSIESPGREDIKKKVTIKPEMASLLARTYSEKLENPQEKHKASENEWEFSPVTESGNYVAARRLEAIRGSEGILENEPTVGSPHLAQGLPFPKDLRDHSTSIPHPRTKVGKKCILSNLPVSLWKKDENEQLSSNVGSTVQDRNHNHSGIGGQASPQESGDSLMTDGKVSRPERLRPWKRNDVLYDAQGLLPLPEGSQEGLDTGCHSDRNSAPCVVFFSGPEHSPKDFSTLELSVGISSRSPKELNMSVEPPSPTEEESGETVSDLSPDESEMMMLMELRKFPRSTACDQTDLSNYNSEAASPQPSEPGTAPYPSSSTLLAMPVPEGRSSDSLVEEQDDHPRSRGWLALENADAMHFISSSRNPFLQSWPPEGPGRIGWKQYVFGSASDVSCSQISWSLDTPTAICCSGIDNGLGTLSSPFHSHLSSYANPHGLSGTLGIEDPQGLEEERKACKVSHVFRNHHGFSDTSITAPSARTPDKVGKGLPEDSKLSQDDSTLTEQEGVSGQTDDTGLPYPTKSESWPKAGVATCEQGTVTLAPTRPQQVPVHCQGCVDITHPNSEAALFRLHPPLASWTNMQNVSMHLSQLLHNTSELLGNLSHQGTGEKEQSINAEAPEEAPKTVTMDNSTQTTVDVGIQTDKMDPAPQDVSLHSPGNSRLASPQEANVTTPEHGSLDGMDALDVPQEKVDHPSVLQEKGPGDTAERTQTSSSPGSQRHYPIAQNNLGTSHHGLSFQKHSLAQDLLSLQDSSATLSSQRDGSSCTVVTSPTLCTVSSARSSFLQDGGSSCDSGTQKNKKVAFRGTLLVDRASSPILTLSANTQGSYSSSSSSSPTYFRASLSHSTAYHQKPGAAWVAPVNNFSQIYSEGEIGNISGDSEKSTGKKLSNGSLPCNPSGTLTRTLWLQESSASTSTGTLNHPQQLQVRASLGLLGWEGQLAGEKEKHSSWERPLYLSLPMTGLSPTKGQSEASNSSNFVAEVTLEAANPVLVRLASQSTSWCQKTGTGVDSLEQPLKSPPTLESTSWRGVLNHCHGPSSISEVSVAPGVGSTVRDTQSEVLLGSCTQKVQASEPRHYSLKDLPVHNKFSNWRGVQGSSSEGTVPVEEAVNVDSTCSEGMGEKPAQPHEHLSLVPEQLQREQVQVLAGVPLERGPKTPPLSVELAEAKLLYGLGETDALLRVMQSGTGEALVPVTPTKPHQEETYFRHLKTFEVIRRERSDRLQNFRRARSLSPMKRFNLLPTPEALVRDPDLPSRRREYLQQLRKDVVETTRKLEPLSDARGHQLSDIEVLLRDYQRAREETKMEIARARDRLRERAEQEKQRIRQQIVSQLQREEARLQTLVSVSTLCTTSSMDSLSSSPTSGYDSSNLTLASQNPPSEKQGNASLSCFKETTGGNVRGRSVVRNHQLYLTGPVQKNLGHKPGGESHRVSFDGPQKSLISQSDSDNCLSTSPCTLYHDLVKHILASTMAEVMAACSDNLQNLFSCQATAGWKYQGEEKDVLTYYKAFPSATRHGFLGAGVVPQPLPRVWAAVRDPTMWTLYDKSIQTAQLYQNVTSSIKLVYLVSNTSLSCLKQPRDFCCVSSEAKEGQLTIMVAQSVYDKSLPRPSKNMIRGEILPSAWVLLPHTIDGKEVTKVIHMVQVELGAPGLPPGLLPHCAKQQPLVIANLASFLCG